LSEARIAAMAKAQLDWLILIGICSSVEGAYTYFRHDLGLGKREYSAAQIWHLDRICNA
jgi:hypothetical protein